MSTSSAVAGVSDHGGWAIIVTVASDGSLLDRRRVELVDDALPAIPHHLEGQVLPIDRAIALVGRVCASAEKHAVLALDVLAADAPQIGGIALRRCPPLPPTIAERITDYRARNVADWVMYREALASAAEARGWRVYWCDAKLALASGNSALELRAKIGPPWTKEHKLAMALALSALEREQHAHGAIGQPAARAD